jgi:hypothetical protein
MKFILSLLLALGSACMSLNAQTQNPIDGAWQLTEDNKTHHILVQDGLYFYTVHQGNQFLMTQGGFINKNGDNTLTASTLFNSADSSKVGSNMQIPFSVSNNQLSLTVDGNEVTYNRVDDGKAPLAGLWRITGRMQEDGKIAQIHQTGTRQTLKLLTGSKFQWVAMDPAKKQFSGTGGGSYTFKDGKYTENITFFSRDNSRVGASLVFDGKLKNGDWHHSGLSSKGAKIYEVWSKTPIKRVEVIVTPPPPRK